jgi:hypothetical protein
MQNYPLCQSNNVFRLKVVKPKFSSSSSFKAKNINIEVLSSYLSLSTQASHNSKPHPFHSTFRIPKKLPPLHPTPLKKKKNKKKKVHNERGPKMVILCIFLFFFLGFRFCRLFAVAVCSVQCAVVCSVRLVCRQQQRPRDDVPTRQCRASRLASSPRVAACYDH